MLQIGDYYGNNGNYDWYPGERQKHVFQEKQLPALLTSLKFQIILPETYMVARLICRFGSFVY